MLDSIAIEPALWPTSALIDWIGILKRVSSVPQRDERLKEALGLLRARLNFQGTRDDVLHRAQRRAVVADDFGGRQRQSRAARRARRSRLARGRRPARARHAVAAAARALGAPPSRMRGARSRWRVSRRRSRRFRRAAIRWSSLARQVACRSKSGAARADARFRLAARAARRLTLAHTGRGRAVGDRAVARGAAAEGAGLQRLLDQAHRDCRSNRRTSPVIRAATSIA